MGGAFATKSARQVDPAEPVEVLVDGERFVGRGGEKLQAALEGFGLAVTGLRVLDAGSSTGGFTECLLRRGASGVVAVDVGRAQLHERLRGDPRVEVMERTDVRDLTPERIGALVDAATADLSFISLVKVLDPLLRLVRPGGPLVLLVKPQFEAGKAEADRGRGVIADPSVWRRVIRQVIDALVERGASIMGLMVSPLRGADGNVEFFVWACSPSWAEPETLEPGRVDAVVAEASGEAG